MATLQKIRNRAVLLTLIIGLALFAFIIGDFLNSGSSLMRQSQEKIATIGESTLDYKEYEARILEMEEVYKIQTGQSTMEDAVSGQIRESVFESLVRERLLDQQAEKLGVCVTSKEVFAMINGATIHPLVMQLPIFQNPQTGQFDRSIMMNFLQTIQLEDLSAYDADAQTQIKQLKSYWLFWENNLKYTRLEEKINTLLTKAVQANSLDAEAHFANRSEQVDFAYVMKPYSLLPDSLYKVSNSDLKKRYSLKKERYYQRPYRSANYVLVNVVASNDDFKAVETKINSMKDAFAATEEPAVFANSNSEEAYNDCYIANTQFDKSVSSFLASSGSMMEPTFSEDVYRMARVLDRKVAPDSVKARQIILPLNAETRADSLLTVLRKGGDFQALATRFSSSANSDMGWFRELDALQLGEDFIKACFSASKDAYFTVKTKYDIRVMQVTDLTKAVAKSKVALISLKVSPSSITYSNQYNALNRIVAENQNAESFFAAAQQAGYEVQQAEFVRKNDNTIAEIPQMRQAVRFVFNNELGDVSPILENTSNQFVVVGITAVSDGDYQTLENVKQPLTYELMNELKADDLAEKITAMNPTTLAQFGVAEGLKIDTARYVNFSMRRITGAGEEPALVAAVMSAEPNKVSAPVKGKNGVYVFQVLSKTKTDEVFNIETEKRNYNSNNMYRIMYQGFDAVRKASKVEDNRIRFY